MKLIAETQQESRIVNGLSALLFDLGVSVDSYHQNEAIAVTFFSADNLAMSDAFHHMTPDAQAAFLYSIEDVMRNAMLEAGYRVIDRALRCEQNGLSHPDRHINS